VRSRLASTDSIPVLAAGVGLRHRSRWLLRSVRCAGTPPARSPRAAWLRSYVPG